MRLGKRERARKREVAAIVARNLAQPKPPATSGIRMARIDTNSLMVATHHMGYLEAGRGKSRPEPDNKRPKRFSEVLNTEFVPPDTRDAGGRMGSSRERAGQ